MRRLVIIDPDEAFVSEARHLFRSEGYRVESFKQATSGLAALRRKTFDLVLIEANLPDADGFAVCHQIREDRSTTELPLIFVTWRDGVEARVAGLRAGADDYIVKPPSLRELVARANAVIRRASGVAADPAFYRDPILAVFPESVHVVVNGGPVPLSFGEMELLEVLIRHSPAPMTPEQILAELSLPRRNNINASTLYARFRSLRRKLGTTHLEKRSRFGYSFSPPSPKARPGLEPQKESTITMHRDSRRTR